MANMVVAVHTFVSWHPHVIFEYRLKHGACDYVTYILQGPVKVTNSQLT
jgi:hypothetical protein